MLSSDVQRVSVQRNPSNASNERKERKKSTQKRNERSRRNGQYAMMEAVVASVTFVALRACVALDGNHALVFSRGRRWLAMATNTRPTSWLTGL